MKRTLLASLLTTASSLLLAQSVTLTNMNTPSSALVCPTSFTSYQAIYNQGLNSPCNGSYNYHYKYTVTGGTFDGNSQTTLTTSPGTFSIDNCVVYWNNSGSCPVSGSLKVEVIADIPPSSTTLCCQTTLAQTIGGNWNTNISGTTNILSYGNYTYTVSSACGATSYNWGYPPSWSVVSGAGTNSITFSIQTGDSPGNVTCTPVTSSHICPTSLTLDVHFSECLGKPLGQYDPLNITSRMVSGDFDSDGDVDDVAALYNYGNNTAKMHVWLNGTSSLSYQGDNGWWQSTAYDATKIKGFVNGDFDNDGFKDDIAAIYYYGSFQTQVHMFFASGSSFSFASWYNNTTYDGNKVNNRVVSGDFDSDGYIDDMAAFYDYGNFTTTIHVWKGTGTGLNGPTTNGWYTNSSYDATKITGRVVAGDFDRDGKFDDITAFYDYGSFTTTAHVWIGNTSSFIGPSTGGWWSGSSYDATKITGRVVSGDFNRDGFIDDIAAFYDYGNLNTTIHVWTSTGSSFNNPATSGWWSSSNYNAAKLSYRVVSGEFVPQTGFYKKRHRYAIAGMYDYDCFSAAIHVWNGSSGTFAYQGDDGRWSVCDDCTPRLAGPDFTYDDDDDDTMQIRSVAFREVTIYPNPMKDRFYIAPGAGFEGAETMTYRIMSIDGRQIQEPVTTSGNSIVEIDMSSEAAGIYIVEIVLGETKLVRKIIKE